MGVLISCDVCPGKLFRIWCTFVLSMHRFGRILANVAIWVDFSRSKWSLKLLHAEFRQGTPRINCASIILNEFTHQTNRRTLLGPDADKSRSKSAASPTRGRPVVPGIRPQGITTGRRGSRGWVRKWHGVALLAALCVANRYE